MYSGITEESLPIRAGSALSIRDSKDICEYDELLLNADISGKSTALSAGRNSLPQKLHKYGKGTHRFTPITSHTFILHPAPNILFN